MVFQRIYCQLEWGVDASSVHVCFLLYVTPIWYNGVLIDVLSIGVEEVHVSSVYVQSAIYESYLV